MLGEPGKGLARSIGFAHDMGGRGGILEHGEVGVVLLRLSGIGAESAYAQFRESEALYLGHIDGGIDINEVGRRTVGLVAHLHAVAVAPADPLTGEVLEEEIGERFAVVAHHLGVTLGKLPQLVQEVVAAADLELVQERRGPVGLIDLVRVIEEGGGPGGACLQEGTLDALEIVGHGGGVEVVDDKTLSPGGGTLHLLAGAVKVEGDDAHAATAGTVGAAGYKGKRLPAFHIGQGGRETGQAVTGEGLINHPEAAGGLLKGYVGTAERPARATVHIDLDAQPLSFLQATAEHLHPTG